VSTKKYKGENAKLLEIRDLLIENGHNLRIKTSGYSMYPFFKPGEVVEVQCHDIQSFNIGDVIVFRSVQNFVAHRLITKKTINNKLILTTKGDSMLRADKSITSTDIVGKIISFEKNNKSINFQNNYYKRINYLLAKISYLSAVLFWFTVRFIGVYRRIFNKK